MKKTIERLIESENRLSALITNLQMGVLLEDENGKIILTNQMFCDMFGLSTTPEQMIGRNSYPNREQLNLFKSPSDFISRSLTLLKERETVVNDLLELSDGRVYTRSFIPIFVGDVYKGHLWKFTDITLQKKAEEALIQREEKYRNIMANMNLGLLEIDTVGTMLFANQRFCDITGYAMEEIIGQNAGFIFAQNDNELNALRERFDGRIKGKSELYELAMRNKRGELRWLLISGAPRYNNNGEFIGSVGIQLDYTNQKEQEQELIQARKTAEVSSKAKEAFLANMSHEIRTPLNAIIGMVRELSRESTNPKQKNYLLNTDISAKHLLSIINNILDISKIDAGVLEIESTPFCLHQIIDETITIVSNHVIEKQLELELVFCDKLQPVFWGDPTRIRQILLNLMSNAIKFTEKGKIKLSCTSKGSCTEMQFVNIVISDTGIGMEKDYLLNLFNKFSQEDKTIARKFGGTGLGMAITRDLIELMHGTIQVKSEKNVGTEISIDLRLKIGAAHDIENMNSPHNLDMLRNINVLLVEDNELNRLVASNTLAHYNALVVEAKNGIEAVEVLKKTRFDIILMDLQMPEMDGIEATKIIRNKLKINTPIIAFTANAIKKEIAYCLAIGMNDYVIKPFEEDTLMNTMLKCLKLAENQASLKAITPVADEEKHSKLFDLTNLFKTSRGNKAFVDKMVRLFIAQSEAGIIEFRQAYIAEDLVAISAIAHRIKPSIHNLSIHSIQNEIKELEALKHTALDKQAVLSLIDHVEFVLKQVIEALTILHVAD